MCFLSVCTVRWRSLNDGKFSRGDRRPAEARQDFQTVHSIPTYDLEINSERPLEENVTLLSQAWKERKRPSALEKMIEEMNVQK